MLQGQAHSPTPRGHRAGHTEYDYVDVSRTTSSECLPLRRPWVPILACPHSSSRRLARTRHSARRCWYGAPLLAHHFTGYLPLDLPGGLSPDSSGRVCMTIGGTSPPDARRFCDPQRHTHHPPGREWLGPHAFSRGCCHWPSGQGHVLNHTLRTTAFLHGRPPPGRATARMPLRQPDASPSRGDLLSRYWTSYRSPPLGTVRDAPSAYPTTGTAALPRLSSVCCAGTRDPSLVAAMRLPAARATF